MHVPDLSTRHVSRRSAWRRRLADASVAGCRAALLAALLGCGVSVAAASPGTAIVADHTTTDLSMVPEAWIETAKDGLQVAYGYFSHGSQVITGMRTLREPPGSLYWFDATGSQDGLVVKEGIPAGSFGSLETVEDWVRATRDMLDDPANANINVVVWAWEGRLSSESSAYVQAYLNDMALLQTGYPSVTFVHMTGHLDGTGESGNLHLRNEQIRAHVAATGGVLFDYADIESFDPDGVGYLALNGSDDCSYSGGNWADEWCAKNPGDPLCTANSCAHSRSLNCNLKARAFWWMLARVAGWEGVADGEPAAPKVPMLPALAGLALLALLLLVGVGTRVATMRKAT